METYSLLSHYMLHLFTHADILHCFDAIRILTVYMDKFWDVVHADVCQSTSERLLVGCIL